MTSKAQSLARAALETFMNNCHDGEEFGIGCHAGQLYITISSTASCTGYDLAVDRIPRRCRAAGSSIVMACLREIRAREAA